jgi:hypothetical protein
MTVNEAAGMKAYILVDAWGPWRAPDLAHSLEIKMEESSVQWMVYLKGIELAALKAD